MPNTKIKTNPATNEIKENIIDQQRCNNIYIQLFSVPPSFFIEIVVEI